MNRKLMGLASAVLLGVSGLAVAQNGWQGERGAWSERERTVQRYDNGRYGYGYGYRYSPQPRYGEGYRYSTPPRYVVRSWRRGERLPQAYFGPRYVVRDYGHYGLYAPPRGYRWVRADNDWLLAAVATGLIADVLLGH